MITHNIDPVIVDFGIVQIRWYSIAYILGILLGWIYIKKIIANKKKNLFNLVSEKTFDNLLVYLILGIIIGGRLGYVVVYNFQYYFDNFLEIFAIWNGGMSFHGGLLGVIIATYIFGKKNKIDFLKITDLIACASPIGIFFGRIANFINGELYGKISNLPWSVIFPNSDNFARHPSQIYEAFLEGVVLFIVINFIALKKNAILKTGLVSSLFLIFYSILRMIGEIFREPDEQIGYFLNFLSMGTVLSLITIFIGIALFLNTKKNEKIN